MQVKTILSLLLTVMFLITNIAIAEDINSPDYTIERVSLGNDKIAFKFCSYLKVPTQCEWIGSRFGYSVSELEKIKSSELLEARLKTGGAVVVGIIGLYVSALGAGSLVLAVGPGASSGELAFIFGTILAGGTTPFWFDRFNPFHQFDQAEVLGAGLLTNEYVEVENQAIFEIKELLSQVLY